MASGKTSKETPPPFAFVVCFWANIDGQSKNLGQIKDLFVTRATQRVLTIGDVTSLRQFTMKHILLLIATIITIAVAPSVRAQWVQSSILTGDVSTLTETGANGSSPLVFAGIRDSGFFHSENSGATWEKTNVGLTDTDVISLAVLGQSEKSQILFAATSRGGVFRSMNNGTSWSASNIGLAYTSVYSLLVDDWDEATPMIFAGTWGDGIFISTDSGTSWSGASNGLPANSQIRALALSDTTLIAGTFSDGVYLSSDHGANWTSANNGLPGSSILSVVVNGTYLFVGTNNDGIFRSTNNGTNWTPASKGLTNNEILCMTSSGNTLFAGTLGGLFYSIDSGTSWLSPSLELRDTAIGSILVDGTEVLAGTTHSGIWRSPSSYFGINAGVSISSVGNFLSTYPNPFTESTTITFTTPESGVAEVSVVNLLGTEVARIFSGELSAGEHTFTWNATGLPDGMYECIVRMNGQVNDRSSTVQRVTAIKK